MTCWTSGVSETNGVRIHYLRTGMGSGKPPIVLLHGLMGSGACWTPLARALRADFDVIMPDARGHGDSSTPSAATPTSSAHHNSYRYDDHADDVVGLVRSLSLVHSPVLLGHSMGGMTAAVVASRRAAALRALVLVDPTFLSPERQREVYASDVAEQHRRVLGLQKSDLVAQAQARSPHRSLEIISLQADARLKTRIEAFEVLAPPNPDYRDIVRAIDMPTLLVTGDSSPVITHALATEIQAMNARIHVEEIADAGHGIPFEQPERLNNVVLSFLRGGKSLRATI